MRRATFALALLALTFGGCGSDNAVWVTGKLLKGGKPYQPPADQRVSITFIALEAPGEAGKAASLNEPYQATLDPVLGTFEVPGREGRGIPTGKYRISVIQKMKREALKRREFDRDVDTLKDRFGPTNAVLIREIKGSGEVVVDLDNPGGT